MSPVQETAAGREYLGAIGQRPGGMELVDEESGLSWPSGVEDSGFSVFLDRLEVLFASRPSAADATIDLDEDQISEDVAFVQSHGNVAMGLRSLVELRHAATIKYVVIKLSCCTREREKQHSELVFSLRVQFG
jgi:hypothetical protein